MNGPNTGNEASSFGELLIARYPLLNGLRITSGAELEPIPPFFSLCCALADSKAHESVCVIVPASSQIAHLTAILVSVIALNRKAENFTSASDDINLPKGTRVRVLPNGYVYTYLGKHPDCPTLINLGFLGGNGSRCIKADQISRLSPTEATLPVGKGDSILGTFHHSNLDLIAQSALGGNAGFIGNAVMLLSPRTGFESTLSNTKLLPQEHSNLPHLSEILPWGRVRDDGSMSFLFPPAALGEPLIAVSGLSSPIAAACDRAPAFSKIVIADGLSSLANNPQDFDRISERQKLVVFCTPDERERTTLIRDRGAVVWELGPEDIPTADSISNGAFSKVLQRINNVSNLKTSTHACHFHLVEEFAQSVEQASRLHEGVEDTPHAQNVLDRLYNLLYDITERWDTIPSSDWRLLQTKVQETERAFRTAEQWLSADRHQKLEKALAKARTLFSLSDPNFPAEKGEALLTHLTGEMSGTRNVVGTKSPIAAQRLTTVLDKSVPVVPVSNCTATDWDNVILAAWPGGSRLKKLMNSGVAPFITLVGYDFECRWFERVIRRIKAETRPGLIEAATKAKLLGFEVAPKDLVTREHPGGASSEPLTPDVADDAEAALKFQERPRFDRPSFANINASELRQARFVRFTGNSYAYFTEWHAVPWLTPLLEGTAGIKGVQTRYVQQLTPGDFLLFRDGSDKDIIRLIAENDLGEKQYSRLRTLADAWRTALESISPDPQEAWSKLRAVGLNKTEAAVRGWMLDPQRIGPGSETDYEAIAKVSLLNNFVANWRQVWTAVREVRRLHIRAGHQLSRLLLSELPRHITEIGVQETRLDLGFGAAWVVQVQQIADKAEPVPSQIVNQLKWDGESETIYDQNVAALESLLFENLVELP